MKSRGDNAGESYGAVFLLLLSILTAIVEFTALDLSHKEAYRFAGLKNFSTNKWILILCSVLTCISSYAFIFMRKYMFVMDLLVYALPFYGDGAWCANSQTALICECPASGSSRSCSLSYNPDSSVLAHRSMAARCDEALSTCSSRHSSIIAVVVLQLLTICVSGVTIAFMCRVIASNDTKQLIYTHVLTRKEGGRSDGKREMKELFSYVKFYTPESHMGASPLIIANQSIPSTTIDAILAAHTEDLTGATANKVRQRMREKLKYMPLRIAERAAAKFDKYDFGGWSDGSDFSDDTPAPPPGPPPGPPPPVAARMQQFDDVKFESAPAAAGVTALAQSASAFGFDEVTTFDGFVADLPALRSNEAFTSPVAIGKHTDHEPNGNFESEGSDFEF